MRSLIFSLCLAGVARAECPLPQLPLQVATPDDPSFDVPLTKRVLQTVWAAATRARSDGKWIEELGLKSDSGAIAYATFSLATRLRQLDCAVMEGHAIDPHANYAAIADEARAALTGSPPEKIVPVKPVNPARRAVDFRVGGGVLLASGIGFFAGALALTVEAARYKAPPPCTANDFLCFNDLDEAFHKVEIIGAVVTWVLGTASVIAGGVLIYKSNRWAEKARVTPSLTVAPEGAFAKLRFSF